MTRLSPWPLIVVLLVVLAYAPSLGGGWVWDDRYLLAANPAITDPWRLLTESVWGPTGQQGGDLYRPLTMWTFLPGQALWPGPLVERMVNLGLHLLAALAVASLARRAGAGREAAWLGAALFAVHAGASEPVAWITGRHDLLPAVLLLGSWALVFSRPLAAGVLCGLAAWAKEPYLLAPLTLVGVMLSARRWSWGATGLALLGPVSVLVARQLVGLPFPASAAGTDPLPGVGAEGLRLLTLVLLPQRADAVPWYHPAPVAGAVALVLLAVLAAIALAARRERWRLATAPLVGGLLLANTGGMAVVHVDLVADRYGYLAFAGLGVALAAVMQWAVDRGPRVARLVWVLPLAMALVTARRAADWVDDVSLFSASVAHDPDNPHAAFHLGHALQVQQGRCDQAVPLYLRAVHSEPRARTNVMACLLELGELERAAELGPGLVEMGPAEPKVPAATARALALLGRPEAALPWAERAVAAADRAADHVLLGNLRGMVGDLPGAEQAFSAALVLEPTNPEAVAGLAAVRAAATER